MAATAECTEKKSFISMTSEPLSPSSTQPTASHCANTLFKSFYPNANAEAPQNERLAYGHRETIFGLAFSPDGKYLASASQDSTVRVWEVRTHRLLETLRGDADFECLRVAWCPAICDDNNGEQRYLLATAGADGILRLYSASLQKDKLIWKLVGSKDHYQLLNKTTQDRPQIYSLQFVPGPSTNDSSTTDWLLMTSADDAIFLWDVQNQDIISHSILQFGQLGQNQFGGARNPDNAIYIFDAACNNNSLVAVALSDGTCRVLNLFKMQEKQCVLSVPEELVGEKGGHLTALAWDSKGERLVTCIACGKVALWNIQFHSGTILSSFVAILEGGTSF